MRKLLIFLSALLLSTICLASPAGAQFNSYNGIYALNNQTFGLRGNPTIISGGTGYAVNDTITLACAATGTPPVRPVVSVSSVSSGAITGLTVTNAGVFTILPSSDTPATLNGGCTYTQYSTSGSGSGATFSGVLSFIPGGVFGAGTINAGTTPITGTCTSGQYLYNASGILACQTLSGGGNVSNSGTPVNGQIGIWATATTIGGTTLGTGVYSALQAVLNASGGLVGYSGALGTPISGNIANTSGYAASNLTGTTLPAGITTASGLTTVAGGAFASGAFTAAYTCPNASTIALGCAEAGTGLLASGGVFSVAYGTTTGTALQGGGSLGTPSAGNLSNATNYPASALASGAIPGGATINDGNWSGTVLSVAHGGTGVSSPGLIAGTNITSITGTWPNQTINASGGGGAVSSVSNSDSTLTVTPTTGAVVASLNLGHANTWTSTQTFPSPAFTGTVTGAGTIPVGVISATGTPSSTTYLRGDGSWQTPAGGGVSASSPNTWTAAQTFTNSDILLLGSSTGATTFTSANAGATNYTLTFPAATDTVAVLGATQTFSGVNTHSGLLYATATAPASGPAANSTVLYGGTTAPTSGSNAGVLLLGGYLSAAPTLANGQGAIYTSSATGGLAIQGSNSNIVTFYSGNASIQAQLSFTGFFAVRNLANYLGYLWDSGTAPTFSSGFNSGALSTVKNGTGAFTVTVGIGTAGSTGVITLPAAQNDWNCFANDATNPGTVVVRQTAWGTTSATFTAYQASAPATTVNWTNGDAIKINCRGE